MLYTHIAQLMTHTTNVYIASAYLAIMLLSLLDIAEGNQESKGVYIIWTQQKLIPFLSEKFVTKFTDLFLNIKVE